MTARENILGRIRQAQGRASSEPTDAEILAVRAAIARHDRGPLPAIAREAQRLPQFLRECERLGTTAAEVPSPGDVPREVARYLGAQGLERRVVLWREFATLDWAGAGVAIDERPAADEDRVGLTGCYCAIAETGSVLLLSAPEMPKLTALLPETHLCVVRKSRLVNSMEDAFAMMRHEIGEPPRSVFLVSGPSRTADIEQTIVIGAHGPYRVHVILIS
jgi:L-lactate dehydrogenase complex protein LldG